MEVVTEEGISSVYGDTRTARITQQKFKCHMITKVLRVRRGGSNLYP